MADRMLTGRTRYRTKRRLLRRPLLVLQVQVKEPAESPGMWDLHWKDARVEDFGALSRLTPGD